jgi:hypothetical protein
MGELVSKTLVPVTVFGTDRCCKHFPDGMSIDDEPCDAVGYGLMDAVQSWSDCNSAVGHVYRFDNLPNRRDGDTLTVWVDPEEWKLFTEHDFEVES